jgi:hypothetical protein
VAGELRMHMPLSPCTPHFKEEQEQAHNVWTSPLQPPSQPIQQNYSLHRRDAFEKEVAVEQRTTSGHFVKQPTVLGSHFQFSDQKAHLSKKNLALAVHLSKITASLI